MTTQDKLQFLIEKAIEGGYVWPWDEYYLYFNFAGEGNDLELWNGGEYEDATTLHCYAVIFNHDFAKALFGEDTELGDEIECEYCLLTPVDYWPTWQYHLRNAVIAEDPIDYMFEALKGKEDGKNRSNRPTLLRRLLQS